MMGSSTNDTSHNLSIALSDLTGSVPAYEFYDIPEWLYFMLLGYLSYAILTVSVFGVTSNVLIIAIYTKIGFSESINICYCALAISDVFQIIFITWNAVCSLPAFVDLDLPFIPDEIAVPTGGAANDIFCQTTAWITAWISVERCLCVLFPFKVKTYMTRSRTLLALIAISVFIIVPLASLNAIRYNYNFTFDINRNRTILRLFRIDTPLVNQISDIYFVLKAVLLNFLPLIIVMVCTAFLATQLKNSAKWRFENIHKTTGQLDLNLDNANGTSSSNEQKFAKEKYNKDMRIAKTVLLIAATFIFLGTLSVERLMIAVIWPEFRPLMAHGNFYRLVSRFSFFLMQANASVNFIIYYKMGSKFRQTAKTLICKLRS